MNKNLLCAGVLAFLALTSLARAGVTEDWNAVVALDAGPSKKPTTREEAILLARSHLSLQQKELEAFLAKYPEDEHAFDARLRLADVLAAKGKMDGNPKDVDAAMQMMLALEKTAGAPVQKRADAAFHRVSLSMQVLRNNTARQRDDIVDAAKNFTANYPGDRRGPRLLVEVATICDEVPTQKRALLNQALQLTSEDALKHRIADDFKRLDALGQPLDLRLETLQGKTLKLSSLRGNVVVLIFWSAASPPCLLWMRDFRLAYENFPKGGLQVVLVSLDEDRKDLDERVEALQANWPVHFDGKGWNSPVARSLGINALPTVWILDKKGVVRTINARSNYETWIRQLQRE